MRAGGLGLRTCHPRASISGLGSGEVTALPGGQSPPSRRLAGGLGRRKRALHSILEPAKIIHRAGRASGFAWPTPQSGPADRQRGGGQWNQPPGEGLHSPSVRSRSGSRLSRFAHRARPPGLAGSPTSSIGAPRYPEGLLAPDARVPGDAGQGPARTPSTGAVGNHRHSGGQPAVRVGTTCGQTCVLPVHGSRETHPDQAFRSPQAVEERNMSSPGLLRPASHIRAARVNVGRAPKLMAPGPRRRSASH